ncbi:hypothetical protein IWW33_004399 [Pseudomonas sp. BG2dil]|nr:hypothetical protein [Pseudomonas sp. M2]
MSFTASRDTMLDGGVVGQKHGDQRAHQEHKVEQPLP